MDREIDPKVQAELDAMLAELNEARRRGEPIKLAMATHVAKPATRRAVPIKMTPNESRLWDLEAALGQYLGHIWLDETRGHARLKLPKRHKELLRRILAEEPIEYIRDEQTEKRDTYIYNELWDGTPEPMIRGVVNATKGWTHFTKRQSTHQAGERYAKRHGLPPPPRRKPGRRKGK